MARLHHGLNNSSHPRIIYDTKYLSSHHRIIDGTKYYFVNISNMCFIWSQTVQTTAFVLDTDNMEALEPLKGRLHKMTFSWNLGVSSFLFWIDLLFQECVFFSLSTFMVNPWPLAQAGRYSEKFPRKQILGSGGAAWAEFHRAGNFWTRKNPFVCEHFHR